jgi:hypothetical protein
LAPFPIQVSMRVTSTGSNEKLDELGMRPAFVGWRSVRRRSAPLGAATSCEPTR